MNIACSDIGLQGKERACQMRVTANLHLLVLQKNRGKTGEGKERMNTSPWFFLEKRKVKAAWEEWGETSGKLAVSRHFGREKRD